MNWEASCKEQLEAVLTDHFPEGVLGRGDAVMIFATGMSLIHKTIKAFGNCDKCWGKGYATSAEQGPVVCGCDRGKQLERIVFPQT